MVSALNSNQAVWFSRSLHSILGQDTFLSGSPSLSRCILGTGDLNAGGNSAMD